MAITMMCGKDEPGAVLSPNHYGSSGDIYLRTFAVGMVVEEYENNFYEDSDFYAVYFEDGVFKKIQYATTRGWTYPNSAKVDASPELMEKYREYNRAAAEAMRKMNEEIAIEPFVEIGLTEVEARKLAVAYHWNKDTLRALERLIKTGKKGKFRSAFRASLFERIINWLGEDAPKYAAPLTMKQLAYV